jgi:hypothetical protein
MKRNKILYCILLLLISCGLPAVASDEQEKFHKEYMGYVKSLSELAADTMHDVYSNNEFKKQYPIAPRFYHGVGWVGAKGVSCSKPGKIAYVELQKDKKTIWLCEEGLQAVSRIAEALILIRSHYANEAGNDLFELTPTDKKSKDIMLKILSADANVVTYYTDTYLRQIDAKSIGSYGPSACFAPIVAYLVATGGMQIKCERSQVTQNLEQDARKWAIEVFKKTLKREGKYFGVNIDADSIKKIETADFGKMSGRMMEYTVRYLVLHEAAHHILKNAAITSSSASGEIKQAEVEADKFALGDPSEDMELKPVVIFSLQFFWKYLTSVKKELPDDFIESIKMRSLAADEFMCSNSKKYMRSSTETSVNNKVAALLDSLCASRNALNR